MRRESNLKGSPSKNQSIVTKNTALEENQKRNGRWRWDSQVTPRTGAKKRSGGTVDEDGPEANKCKIAAPVGAAGKRTKVLSKFKELACVRLSRKR